MLIKELNSYKKEGLCETKAMICKLGTEKAKTGKEYANVSLQDSTGELIVKCWEADICDKLKVGDIVAFTLDGKEYNGKIGFVIKNYILLQNENPKEYQNSFTPDEQTMISYLRSKIAEIYKERPDLKVVLDSLASTFGFNDFFKWAAGCGVHHATINGLLFHTTSMLKHADKLMESTEAAYDLKVDKQLVNTAIIMHDFFKIKEYAMNEAGRAEVTKYVILGHIQMASQFVAHLYYQGLIDEELFLTLSHALSAHHGELEYGSPVKPATLEAHIIHTVDIFDSRVYIFKDELRKINEGELSANRNFALGTNVYHPIQK